jgi:hypothetical protein
MFRPRPNAAGGPSKDGGAVAQTEVSASASPIDTVGGESSLPTPVAEESFVTRMMADK